MPECVRESCVKESADLPGIGERRGVDRSVMLKRSVMLGAIGAMLGGLLQGCTAGQHPSQGGNQPRQCG